MENFELQDNTLKANIDLYWEDHEDFKKKCDSLVSSEFEKIVLDLSEVSFIFSAYMGTIGQLLAETSSRKKTLTVRISETIYWLFELSGFDKMVKLEVVK